VSIRGKKQYLRPFVSIRGQIYFVRNEPRINTNEKRKTPLFITDKNDALTFAENDIKDNWEVYKQRFLQEAQR
jgi:hypothetical protein